MRIKHWWFQFKRFALSSPIAFICKYTIKLILWTCKLKIEGLHYLEKEKKGIVMLWHNNMVIMCEFFHRFLPESTYAAFLSKSRDGEPIARAINSYRNTHTIRVAHNLKHEALRSAIAYLNEKKGLLLFTPDGPKGPRCKVKPGIVFAAQESEAPVFSFRWTANRYWEFNTWDRLRIPKPFSTITIVISAPMLLDKNLEMQSALALLEDSLE